LQRDTIWLSRRRELLLVQRKARAWLGEADIVCVFFARPTLKQAAIFRFLLGLAIVLANLNLLSSASANTPPMEENAYCGKGNLPNFGENDGPAQLPKSCYYTGLDGTPSPGKQIKVSANSDLRDAVGSARCGDTLLLAAGASFAMQDLPTKKCDDQHYITIRTDTADSKLPPEGTRISPAWAGVASLAGRPAFAQPPGGCAKLMSTLVVKSPTHLGDHYRFIGIEWVSEPGVREGALVTTEGADHAIFDRNWFHPYEGSEMGKGINMHDGSLFIAVINSYLSGFHCVARTGSCTDATAVGGGYGERPMSTLKIYNNYLEASGENILFGGAKSDVNPSDIEIRRNHIFKPLLWKEGEPGYIPLTGGNPPIVKNHIEFKSGIRALIEANLLENSWGGFSQQGYSILLSPKSQNDKCPKCSVTDITIRYNRIRNVAGGIVLANGFAKTGGSASDGGRYSIHDLIVDSVHDEGWRGQGTFGFLNSNAEMLHDVAFDHVTAFVTGPLFFVGNRTGEGIPNFSLTNSILMAGGRRAEFSSAGGGKTNCAGPAQRAGAAAVLAACFVNYRFEKNIIIGEKGGWPKGTIVVSSPQAAGIRDFKDGVSRDPRLCHASSPGCSKASPGAAAATDGKDIGADVDAVDAALAGVE
jgi:hypothetical protein